MRTCSVHSTAKEASIELLLHSNMLAYSRYFLFLRLSEHLVRVGDYHLHGMLVDADH